MYRWIFTVLSGSQGSLVCIKVERTLGLNHYPVLRKQEKKEGGVIFSKTFLSLPQGFCLKSLILLLNDQLENSLSQSETPGKMKTVANNIWHDFEQLVER